MSRSWPILLAMVALPVCGCGTAGDPWEGEKARKRVVVTIPALASFVRAVGGDDVAVRSLCTTTGPHEAKPDSRDAGLLARADLLFSVGLSLDDNLADTLYALARNTRVGHVKLGTKVSRKLLLEMKHDHHDHGHEGHGHHHHHGHYDPHLWLGVPEAIEMVNAIASALGEADEQNKETYEKNAAAYVRKLKDLQAEGLKLLEGKKNRRIISFHDSFQYFARSFGLSVAATMELSPGDEPSAGHLAKLVKEFKDTPVGAITVEPQYAEGTAKKLAEALGKVQLAKVDPMETAEAKELKEKGARWYLDRLEANVKALADALP